jgi:hypothetical protein
VLATERLNLLRGKYEQSRSSDEVDALVRLQAQLKAALRELKKYWEEKSQFTRWKESELDRKRAQTFLTQAKDFVLRVQQQIAEITEPSKDLLEATRSRAETVLQRFSIVDGILPLKLVPTDRVSSDAVSTSEAGTVQRIYAIKTGDGRELRHLSTGQRAQIAISFLTTQNTAIPHTMSHRVLLLDDVTTAYDLSNLTREASLWRQLAYGSEDPLYRRQVFLSSHHEDMTNHLLDLLVPPEGRTMRLIRFTDWTPTDGPHIEQLEVEATQSMSMELGDLKSELESF